MKRKALSAFMAAAMATVLIACSNNGGAETGTATNGSNGGTDATASETDGSDDPTTPGSGETTEIEVWSNNRHDENYMVSQIEAFNSIQSEITINYTTMTDDWANSIQLAFQAGTAPDIITIAASDGMPLSDYVSSGIFDSLSDYIAGDDSFQTVTEVYDHMYEQLNVIGDDIYWVPNGVRSGTRIQYNIDLVTEAGYDGIPDTLEEVVELAKIVTENGGGSYYGVGFTSSGPFGRWLEGVGELSGNTHHGYDYVNGVYDFSSWRELVETAAGFYEDDSVLPGSETQGVDNSRALFAEGSFAIWGNASQEAGVFTDQFPPNFDWGVAELPTMSGEVTGALSMTPNFGFSMISSSGHKDQAWEVISYFSSEDFLKGYFEGGYSAPLSGYMADAIDSTTVGRLADFALQDYEDVYPATPSITLEGDDYATVFFNVIQGYTTIEEAISDLDTRYNDALARGIANGSIKRLVIEDFDPQHPSQGTPQYLDE